MINVTKTELKERTFVPYEITITVNSREDHADLKKQFRELGSLSSDRLFRASRYTAIHALASTIKNHIE